VQAQLPFGVRPGRHAFDGFQHAAADALIGQDCCQAHRAPCGHVFHNPTKDAECLVCQVRNKEFTCSANRYGHGITTGLGQLANELEPLAGGCGNPRTLLDATPLNMYPDQFEGALGILQNLH